MRGNAGWSRGSGEIHLNVYIPPQPNLLPQGEGTKLPEQAIPANRCHSDLDSESRSFQLKHQPAHSLVPTRAEGSWTIAMTGISPLRSTRGNNCFDEYWRSSVAPTSTLRRPQRMPYLSLREKEPWHSARLNKHLYTKLNRPCSHLVVLAVLYWYSVGRTLLFEVGFWIASDKHTSLAR